MSVFYFKLTCGIKHWNDFKIISKLDSLRWFSQRRSPKPTFFGVGAPREGYDPQIRTRPRFLYNAPTPKFCHRMFTRSEVIVSTNKHTNKQTPLKTFYFACNHGSDTTGRRKTAVADCEVLGIGEWPQQKLLLIGDLKHNQIKWTDLQAGAKINNATWALITKIT